MIIEAHCELSLRCSTPVPSVFMLRPRSGLGQWVIREECVCRPHLPMSEYTDGFGNLCQRAVIQPGDFSLISTCLVDTPDVIDVNETADYVYVENLPDPLLQFLLPSRYCQSDQLGDLAKEIAGTVRPGYCQAESIRAWIRGNIRYRHGASTASTSALETARSGEGVCRDFAHLGIALCRALNIPARMVVGFLHELDPMDLHAWFEAYAGFRWYTFDATQQQPKGNRISLAYGRDAADVAFATQFGPLELQNMKVSVAPGKAP